MMYLENITGIIFFIVMGILIGFSIYLKNKKLIFIASGFIILHGINYILEWQDIFPEYSSIFLILNPLYYFLIYFLIKTVKENKK